MIIQILFQCQERLTVTLRTTFVDGHRLAMTSLIGHVTWALLAQLTLDLQMTTPLEVCINNPFILYPKSFVSGVGQVERVYPAVAVPCCGCTLLWLYLYM